MTGLAPGDPQEQKWTFGQGDSSTVADSTSQSGRRRKCKTGKCEKEIDKSEENVGIPNTLLPSGWINELTGACKLQQEV